MDTKELRGLIEAYSEVYAPTEIIDEEKVTKLPSTINRRRASSLTKTSSSGRPALGTHDPSKGSYVGKGDIAIGSGRMGTLNPVKSLGRDYKGDKDAVASKYKEQIKSDRKAAAKERSKTGEDRLGKLIRSVQKEELDIFDIVLEFLQVEGIAETLEEAEWMMANIIDEEAIEIILGEEQLDEISQKTATKAYAQSATGEFEGANSERDVKRTNNLRKHIERKFGKKAAQDADKHADATTFGRKDPRTGKRQPSPKPRIEKNRTYRTTKAGKMHGQDQSKLKRDLKYNRFVED